MRRKQRKKLRIYGITLLIQSIVLVAVLANADKFAVQKQETTTKEKTSKNTEVDRTEIETDQLVTEEQTTVDNNIYKVSLVAVGDNLVSDSVTHCGLQSDGSYEFSELFEELKAEFINADLAVINQETILGGPDFEYTGYPNFNNPYEIGDAVIDAGFDVVLHATNHTYDMGVKGIENCIGYWEKHPEITVLGMNKNEKEYNKIKVIEKNNISIALLNYTYSLNGYSLPDGKEYMVNLIDEEKIMNDIKKAEEIADFTIVFPHWGIEYTHTPTDEQVELAELMTNCGADLIIGTHPHVVEDISWVQSENGNKSLCYYSLGNYSSSQDKTSTMLGAIAKLNIVKKGNDVYIEEAGAIPIVTHYIWGAGRLTKTYRLTDYTNELASKHSINTVTNDFSLDHLKEISEAVLGDWVID